MPTGSRKWPTSHWREMLHDILPVIDDSLPAESWVLGGGTSIAMRLGHRVSYDLDFFLENSRLVRGMAPGKNERVKAFLGDRLFQFPGHYLKLELEHGEIDFIVASGITDAGPDPFDFEGRTVPLEAFPEIAAKKVFFRASDFLVRDIFDLIALRELAGLDLDREVFDELPEDRLPRLLSRLEAIVPHYGAKVREEVNPTDLGRTFMAQEKAEEVLALVRRSIEARRA